jgi:hypothetical protein
MLLDAGFEDRCPSASYRIFSEELLVKPRTGDWRKTMLWCKSSISALLLRVSEANEVLSRYFASFWRPSIFEIKSFITPLLRTPPRGGRQGSPGSTLKCTAPYPRVEIKDVANEYYFRHDWAIKSLYYVKSRQWYEGLRCYLWPESVSSGYYFLPCLFTFFQQSWEQCSLLRMKIAWLFWSSCLQSSIVSGVLHAVWK